MEDRERRREETPGRLVSGELQHRLVKHGVGVDVHVLGDRQLDRGADADTLGQRQEGLHPTGPVIA